MAIGSNVNPNFPIPGIDNSSKGFRDNFSAIKAEIEALQSKRIVITGGATGDALIDGSNNDIIINTTVTSPSVSAGGDDMMIQFNAVGALDGSSNLMWDYANGTLIVGDVQSPDYNYWLDSGMARIHDTLTVEGSNDTARLYVKTNVPHYPEILISSDNRQAKMVITNDVPATPLVITIDATSAAILTSTGLSLGSAAVSNNRLEVYGTAQSNIAVFTSSHDNSDNAVRLHTEPTNSTIGLVLQQTDADMVGGIRIGTEGSLSLHVNGNNESWLNDSTRALIIDPQGKVSIGTDMMREGDRLTLNTGNLNIIEPGYGIVFPDGTYQDTSALPTLSFLSQGDPGTVQLANLSHEFQGNFDTLHYDLTNNFLGANPSLALGSSGTKHIVLDPYGYLGLGNFDPYMFGKLTVQGGQFADSDSSAALLTPGVEDGEIADLALFGSLVGMGDTFPKRTADLIAGFTGDWGTEYLAFGVGGSDNTSMMTAEKMRLNAIGLGIGTASPSSKLAVLSGINDGISVTDGTVRTVMYSSTGGTGSIGTTSNHPLAIYTNNSIKIIIDPSGNAGIGTQTPSAKLHVHSTTLPMIISSSSDTSAMLEFQDGAGTTNKWRIGSGSDTTTDGKFFIYDLRQNATRMVVDTSGNVGIGTSSPAQKLDIVGTLQLTNTLTPANTSYVYDGGGLVLESNNNNPMYFYTGGVEGIRMDQNQRVGIGTDANLSTIDAILAVAGGAVQFSGGTTAQAGLRFQTDGSLFTLTGINQDNDTNNTIVLKGGSNNTLAVKDGLVGINTTVPGYELDVNGQIFASTTIEATSPAQTSPNTHGGFRLRAGSDDATNVIQFVNHVGDTERGFIMMDVNHNMIFVTNNIESYRVVDTGTMMVGGVPTNLPISGGTNMYAAKMVINQASSWSPLVINNNIDQDGNTTGNFRQIELYGNGNWWGQIYVANGAAYYANGSDHRLKENVVPLNNSIDRVKQLRPVSFNFISAPDKSVPMEGFIAHEAQQVIPSAVSGSKDAMMQDGTPHYQSMDYAKVTPLLVSALQEAVEKIEALEARIAALESK